MLVHNKPLACDGLHSFRYRGRYGWVMIGANDDADALREAARSVREKPTIENLQRWDGKDYVKCIQSES